MQYAHPQKEGIQFDINMAERKIKAI